MNLTELRWKGSAVILILLCTAALGGDFLSPVPASELNTSLVFAPPSRLHFADAQGRIHWRPFFYRLQLEDPVELTYRENRNDPISVRFFFTGYTYRLFGFIPASIHLAGGEGFHLLGTDDLGRDVLARMLKGAGTSLLVVAAGICLYAVIGLTAGTIAAVAGGWVDSLLMRLCEIVLALPALYLILALRAILPLRMPYSQTFLLTVGTIAGVAWPTMARAVRGTVQQILRSGYVEAAVSLGCTRMFLIQRHLLPALPPLVFSQMVVAAPIFLLGEMSLSFLNMGFGDATESWGTMLRGMMDYRILTDFWWNLAPLGCVFATLLCLNLAGSPAPAEQQSRL